MEIHIFVTPLNPSPELQASFKKVCSEIVHMKCCNLKLDFVKVQNNEKYLKIAGRLG
jgi:hypothetical protein